MSRSRALAVWGAVVAVGLGLDSLTPLGAQEPPARDSAEAARLAPVVISGTPKGRAARLMSRLGVRSRLDQLERENRQMERLIGVYDRRIEQLEARLAFLKSVVGDSLRRDIATLDSATVSIRRQRLALEARARELQKVDTPCPAPDSAVARPPQADSTKPAAAVAPRVCSTQ